MENLYESAFKVLNLLEEEDFEMDDVQDGELKDFLDSDTEETVDIIDPNAEDEEEVKDSYIGDVVLECSVCHSMIYKDASEILKDEESEEDLVNVGEECPYCMSADGYKIVGQITPFEVEADYTVEVEPKEDSEDDKEEAEVKDEEEVEVEDETWEEPVDESLENIDIETEHDNIHIEAEEKEDVDGEMIVPVEPDTEEIIDDNDDVEELEDSEEDSEEAFDDVEVEEIPEEDVDIEEVDEESFDELGESFLKKTYSNVKSFKTTSIQDTGKNLVIEGLISFNSGNTKATTFKFTPDTITKKNKVKFFGENLQINNGKKSFRLAGRLNDGKLVVESLSYNYITKTPKNESKRVSGTVSLKEAKDLTAVEGTAANAMAAAMKDLGSCSTPKAVFDLANKVIPENKKNEAKVKALLKNLQNAKNVVKAQTIFSNFVLKGAGEGSLDKEISGKKNFN